MDPIRPNLPPVSPPTGPPKSAEAARLAAQKAFFDIALGKTAPAGAVRQAAAAAAPLRATAPAQRQIQVPTEPPSRPMRPGSLLDIKV